MIEAITIGLIALPAGLVYASFAEWAIHHRLMHHPIFRFNHFFRGHAQVHHGRYQADSTYTAGGRPPSDVTFAWWAMPFPILLHVPPLTALAVWVSTPAAVGVFIAFALYQATYEYLHYCMHVPHGRWFERTGAFRWITTHHFQHHGKHDTNLNVILPIADYLLGTRQRPDQRALALSQG
jgi:hypothetical protein